MKSVGIDLIEVGRIKKSMENPRFTARVFSKEEQELFTGAHAFERAAANYAAKEAFGKALGTGIAGFSLYEVAVLRDALGAPYLSLSGKAAEIAAERGLRFLCSLTHTAEYAQAIVISLSEEEVSC